MGTLGGLDGEDIKHMHPNLQARIKKGLTGIIEDGPERLPNYNLIPNKHIGIVTHKQEVQHDDHTWQTQVYSLQE